LDLIGEREQDALWIFLNEIINIVIELIVIYAFLLPVFEDSPQGSSGVFPSILRISPAAADPAL
jgi:hypothetical protein